MWVLGIETSCDETAAAVVADGRTVAANVVSSQVPIHAKYGGVVPELASRNHLLAILPCVGEALQQAGLTLAEVDGLAVTQGPGLVGCLLVGVQTAKALAFAHGKPVVGVNHIEGHITAIRLRGREGAVEPPEFPYVALAASGGHTSLYLVAALGDYRILGWTLDDAAGEAFDKLAKLLGLPYPGGVSVERLARQGDPSAVRLPKPMTRRDRIRFSFSGLKTAARNVVATWPTPYPEPLVADLCAAFQEAVVELLVRKTLAAAEAESCPRIVLSGGVAANGRLRAAFAEACAERGLTLFLTPVGYCTDNAAMIAGIGHHYLLQGRGEGFEELDAYGNVGPLAGRGRGLI